MYKIFRNILFLFDAEKVHHFAMYCLRALCRNAYLKKWIRSQYSPKDKLVQCIGLTFRNNIGLAAGFDKNASFLTALETIGFGFTEIGTVTPLAQEGNDKPRLFRLKKDHALINRMGFNNEGVEVIAERLRNWRTLHSNNQMLIGGNIGKNKQTLNENAWQDYVICFLALFDVVDYFVVNVSSPNTPGLRDLQEKDPLREILLNLQEINNSHASPKPILLKISPDLSNTQLDDIIELVIETKLSGIVATNTTLNREHLLTSDQIIKKIGSGGLSGFPLKNRATEVVKYIHQKTQGNMLIIGSGGIFNSPDARDKIAAGASLIQIWTGFIYEGPKILKDLTGRK